MSKKVLYIRHAKSSWDNPLLEDIERPLNAVGRKAAQKMSEYLKEDLTGQNILLISSPAIRALETARYFALAMNIDPAGIWIEKGLYYGGGEDYISVLNRVDEKYSLVMIFGHNPTISQVVSSFKLPFNGHMSTCSVVCCNLITEKWKDADSSKLVLEKSLFPKSLFND